MITTDEEVELITLLEQEHGEIVAPKLDAFRKPSRIKVCYGGRGAGAKSWSIASLLVQRAQRENIQVLCTREIQLSLEESVYRLVSKTVERLCYPGWTFTREHMIAPTGARFYFRGLKDMRAAAQLKSYEGIDIAWVEEAAGVSNDSLDILMPTVRKPGSELWFSFNREEESDPVHERFIRNPRDDSIVVWLEPGKIDNPWWTAELQKEMDEDYKRDPDQAEHIWGGQPRKQGLKAVMSRTAIRGAMDRDIKAEGAIEIGIDVARFGDDLTVMYKRHGLKVIGAREFAGQDTMRTAKEGWDMGGRNPEVTYKVDDDGVGGAVTDKLRELGAKKVMPIHFGGDPNDKNTYTSVADEMWFTFPVNEADIPNDQKLMQELAGRQYDYDSKGRRKIEKKQDFKKRIGRSPDRADALLLAFYERQPIMGVQEYLRATKRMPLPVRGPVDERYHIVVPTRRA